MNKKVFSILLSMILMVSMLAMPVFAEPDEETGSSSIVKTETGNNEEPTDSNIGEKENNQVNNNDNMPQDAVDQQGDNNSQGNEGAGERTTTEPETTDPVIS